MLSEPCLSRKHLQALQPDNSDWPVQLTEASKRFWITCIATFAVMLAGQWTTTVPNVLHGCADWTASFFVYICQKQIFSWHGSNDSCEGKSEFTFYPSLFQQEVEINPPQKKSKKKPPPPRAPSGSPMVTTTTQVPSKPQTRVIPAVTASTPAAVSNTSTVTSASNSASAISSTKAEADALPSQDSSVQSVVPPSVPTKVYLLCYKSQGSKFACLWRKFTYYFTS